jgi:hypothetical protein
LFVFFGGVLLYIILLSFKILAKYIVIPIKNVHYMLEGINVGGEYRLEYLSGLQKKQEENLEKLNKINHRLMQKNAKKNKNLNLNLKELDYKDKEKDQEKEMSKEKEKEKLKAKIEQKKLSSRNIFSNKKKRKRRNQKNGRFFFQRQDSKK